MPAAIRFSFVLSLVVGLAPWSHAADQGAKPDGAAAEAAAQKWLKSLGEKGLKLEERVAEGGFVASQGPSAIGKVTTLRFERAGWWISMSFRGEITADTPLSAIQERFWHISLDRVPTPGLNLPGWEVRPQTPTSSFDKGVTFLAFGNGKIKLRIETRFFALYGRDPAVLVPADAPSPPGSYFQIRQNFPLDLTLEAPVSFK